MVEQLKNDYFATNMDSWVALFKQPEETPTTYSRKMSIEEAKAIVRLYNTLESIRDAKGLDKFDTSSLKLNNVLRGLEKDIDDLIKGKGLDGAMIKLSCRIAKDVTFEHPRTLELYRIYMGQLQEQHKLEENSLDWKNMQLYALYKAQIDCMRVKSFKEALELFVLSNRIKFDLELDLRFAKDFSMNVIVRPWMSIPLECEYRGFVCKGTLTALSQYFTQIFVPSLLLKKDKVKNDISNFFYHVFKPRLADKKDLAEGDYVIDFVALEDRVLVLELNQFKSTTGPGLFDWEKDHKVLFEGPFEFRVLTQPVVNNIDPKSLAPSWRKIIFGAT